MWSIENDRFVRSKNTLSAVLEIVVTPSPPVVVTFSSQHVNMALRFLESHPLSSGKDSVLQVPNQGTATNEARQITLSHEHHLHKNYEFLSVLLESTETSCHSCSEISKLIRFRSTHHINHLLGQLEWSCFKFHSLSGCVWEQETEVNMTNVPFNVDHDIFIVPVFNLKDVANERICSKRIGEIFDGLLVLFASFLSKLEIKVIIKGGKSVLSA